MNNNLNNHIEQSLHTLLKQSHVSFFSFYDLDTIQNQDPSFYYIATNKEEKRKMPLSLDFHGIGLWYMLRLKEESFYAVKIMAFVQNKIFIKGNVADFEGFKDDIDNYIESDQWVQSIVEKYRHTQQLPQPSTEEYWQNVANM